jgi:hypothetical protein
MAKSIIEVNELAKEITTKFCPYKGEHEWNIECIGNRCMKYDEVKKICTRS